MLMMVGVFAYIDAVVLWAGAGRSVNAGRAVFSEVPSCIPCISTSNWSGAGNFEPRSPMKQEEAQ
jgi:hypothetical protein